MADIRGARRRLSLVLIVLFCIDLVCAAVLLSPIRRSAAARQAELKQLWSQLQAKTRDSVPLSGINDKVAQASKQITAFYGERLPASYSAITEDLGQRASAATIRLTSVRYDAKDSDLPDLERVGISASIEGDYLQTMKFINALERDKMFLIIDSVVLGAQQGGRVRLQLQLETYRKTGS